MLPSSILMVCTGNLCRSPFAAFYMQKRFADAQIDVECFSRGVSAPLGKRPPEMAQKIALEFDVNISGHTSQQLLGGDLDRAGLVLVMSHAQRKHVGKLRPSGIGKVFMLSQPARGANIQDPIGESDEVYRRVYQEIVGHVDSWMQRFGF